jgi:uncharacterized membrane protein YcaP (DUF421 family)
MDAFSYPDLRSMFVPSLSLVEIILRGTAVYLLLFALLRVLRREAGAIGVGDLLVVVLIADAAQNAMASEYKSITEGAILVATIAAWDYFLNWLGYNVPWFHRLLRAAPLPLIKDGRILKRNLRQELITIEELMAELRQQGLESVDRVRRCYLEGDGHFSVITEQGQKRGNGKKTSPIP